MWEWWKLSGAADVQSSFEVIHQIYGSVARQVVEYFKLPFIPGVDVANVTGCSPGRTNKVL